MPPPTSSTAPLVEHHISNKIVQLSAGGFVINMLKDHDSIVEKFKSWQLVVHLGTTNIPSTMSFPLQLCERYTTLLWTRGMKKQLWSYTRRTANRWSSLATKWNNDDDMTTPEEKWTEFLKRYLVILSGKTRSTNKGVKTKQANNMSMTDLEISVLCAPKDR